MHRIYRALVLAAWAAGALLPAAEVADQIWTARYVVTMDPARRVIEDGAVAIRGERIVGVGPRAEVERAFSARRRAARPQSILMPGLIDTHTHAAMSLLRAIADDKRLDVWLNQYIFPAEARNVNREFVRWGTLLACIEMAEYGTTTFTDMYYFEETVAEAAKQVGLRGVLGQTVIGFPAPDYKTPAAALEGAAKFLERYKNDPLITPAVAPHAVYTVPDDILKASRELSNRYQAPLLIHLSETKKENDDLMARRGMTPTRLLDSLGVLNGRTVGAHGIWLDDGDLDILRRTGTGLAHCPTSNTKLASGIARVGDILARGIPMGLGTDGFAGSNDGADLMQEMALAPKLQKVTRLDPEALPAREALAMATITGAKALGMDREIGSLEAGKRADLVAISIARANAVPLYDPYAVLVYSLRSRDVSDVLVNGRQIVLNGRVLTVDTSRVLAQAKEYRTNVSDSLTQVK